MISLYSGTPGSGKSLHLASTIYWRLKRGLPVVANFGFAASRITPHQSLFVQVDNDKLSPDFLIKFSRDYFSAHRFGEGRIMLAIDECQLMFNAREWDAQGRKEWLSFFTQHRKYGYDVYLIAQFDRMIDRQVRSLIEYEFKHRKVSNFGWKGFLLSLAMGGNVFAAVKIWYPLKERIGSEFIRARKKLYTLYDTFDTFSDAVPEVEPEVEPDAVPELPGVCPAGRRGTGSPSASGVDIRQLMSAAVSAFNWLSGRVLEFGILTKKFVVNRLRGQKKRR